MLTDRRELEGIHMRPQADDPKPSEIAVDGFQAILAEIQIEFSDRAACRRS